MEDQKNQPVFVPISDDALERFGLVLEKLVPFELDYFRPRIVAEQSGLVYHFDQATQITS